MPKSSPRLDPFLNMTLYLSLFLSFFLSPSLSLSLSLLRVERVCVGERLFLTNCVESESLSSLRK